MCGVFNIIEVKVTVIFFGTVTPRRIVRPERPKDGLYQLKDGPYQLKEGFS